jgi:tRNA A37 N6-isopentenylltransferase MiaA
VSCGNVERWDEIKVYRELDVNTAKRTNVTMKKAQYMTSAGSNDIKE